MRSPRLPAWVHTLADLQEAMRDAMAAIWSDVAHPRMRYQHAGPRRAARPAIPVPSENDPKFRRILRILNEKKNTPDLTKDWIHASFLLHELPESMSFDEFLDQMSARGWAVAALSTAQLVLRNRAGGRGYDGPLD
jgi:hypothetical protein